MTEASDSRRNILLFGVGHSGTSIVSKMLGALGWNLGDADGFGENVAIRRINGQILNGRQPQIEVLHEAFAALPQPWVVKDPRFVLTLSTWMELFQTWPQQQRPQLLYLTRELEKIERTYVAYGEVKDGVPGMYRKTVRELAALAVEGFREWPYQKLAITFEQIIAAAELFSVKRASRRDSD